MTGRDQWAVEPAFVSVDPCANLPLKPSTYLDVRTTRKVGNLPAGEVVCRVYIADEDGSHSRLRAGFLAAILKTLNTLEPSK